MRIFLSHTAYDAPVVQFLKGTIGPQLDVSFFVLPDDAPPGSPWIERIKLGVDSSAGLYSVVTPESLTRPWMSAEWACFWMQGKPTTPLLLEVTTAQLWEPMRAFQTVDLLDPSSMTRFLKSIGEATGKQPPAGVRPLVNEIVQELPKIRERQALGDVDRAMTRLQRTLLSGSPNINSGDVRTMLVQDRMSDLLTLASADEAAPVKQKQIALALIGLGHISEAAQLGERMRNRNELCALCLKLVETMPPGATGTADQWLALERLHGRLGRPQRRDVLEAMTRSGITPVGSWAQHAGQTTSAST